MYPDTLSRGDEAIYKNQDDEDWSPYHLPLPLTTVWAVTQAQGVTDNGGLEYFFENDWPETPPYSLFVNAFREVGAVEAAEYLQQAVVNFPFDEPHLDVDRRREHLVASRSAPDEWDSVIDGLTDRLMELSQDTYAKVEAYILSHPEDFPELPTETEITDSNLPAHLKRPGWKALKFLKSEAVAIFPETLDAELSGFSPGDLISASSEDIEREFTATLHTDPYFLEHKDFALEFVNALAKKARATPVDAPPYRYFADPKVEREGRNQIRFWVIGFPGAVVVVSLTNRKGKPYSKEIEAIHQAIPQIAGMLLE